MSLHRRETLAFNDSGDGGRGAAQPASDLFVGHPVCRELADGPNVVEGALPKPRWLPLLAPVLMTQPESSVFTLATGNRAALDPVRPERTIEGLVTLVPPIVRLAEPQRPRRANTAINTTDSHGAKVVVGPRTAQNPLRAAVPLQIGEIVGHVDRVLLEHFKRNDLSVRSWVEANTTGAARPS